MADLNGIGTAVAVKLASVTGIVWTSSTDLLLPSNDPAGIVTGPSGMDMLQRAFSTELVEYTYNLTLLVSRSGDVGAAQQAALTIFEGIRTAFQQGIQLGYATIVQECWLARYTIGPVTYGGTPEKPQEWYGGNGDLMVRIRDNVTRTA